jgi:hypothetical protein
MHRFTQADTDFAFIRAVNMSVRAIGLLLFVNNSNWMGIGLVFQSIGFCPVPQIHRNERLIIQPLMAMEETCCLGQ